MPEHILITLFAGSQHNELDVVLTEFIHHIGNQVKALLIRQTGNHADHHGPVVLIQSKIGLQRTFILDLFLPEVHRIEGTGDERIGLRIVFIIIDAVHNASQIAASGAHQTVQSLPVEGRLDLLRVGIAHRRNRIRIHQAAL